MTTPIPVYVTTPSEEELFASAARETVTNLVDAIRSLHWTGFKERVWFPFLYRYRLEFDIMDLLRNKNKWDEFGWNFGAFRPTGDWHVRKDDTKLVVMFRREDDRLLFRVGVVK